MSTKRFVQVFTAALFIIAEYWKLLKCPTGKARTLTARRMNLKMIIFLKDNILS